MQPRLDDLSRRYGVTAIGVELPDLEHMIVVTLSRTQAPVRLHVDVGSRFPALISATGRCVAAFSEQPWARSRDASARCAGRTRSGYETWRKEIDGVRRHGFSIDRGNYIAGVAIVAVPVLNAHRTITHTIAAVGLVSQLDRTTSVALGAGNAGGGRNGGVAAGLPGDAQAGATEAPFRRGWGLPAHPGFQVTLLLQEFDKSGQAILSRIKTNLQRSGGSDES